MHAMPRPVESFALVSLDEFPDIDMAVIAAQRSAMPRSRSAVA